MKRIVLLALGLLLFQAGGLRAQVFTPAFLAPQQSSSIGAFLSGGIGDEDGYAVEGIARRSYGAFDLGFRAGVADLDGLALLLGLEYRRPLHFDDVPFDLAATGAAQGIIGASGGPGIAVGVTGGRAFPLQDVVITPYAHPQLALVSGPDEDADIALAPALELGADFTFASDLRFHVALGLGSETANLGFGLSWR